jgi:DNA-binding transcriptional regulator GbsR (MarR family)
MVGATHPESDLAEARSLGIETCGRIAAFWGFTRTMGRVFGLLYLSPDPMTAAEIKRAMGISVGNTSMTLTALQRWGVVKEVRLPGKRGVRYAAETDFWKMIAEVLHRRERAEIVAAVSNVRRAGAHARLAMRRTGAQEKREAEFVIDRLEHLRELSEMGEKMLELLLGELSLDVSRFRHVFRGR